MQCHRHPRARASCIISLSIPLNERSSLELCHLFFTYMIDGIKTIIRPGTPGSEGLHLLLPLMSADLAGEQELGLRCGNSTCFVQPWHPRTYRSAEGRLTHHQYLRLDARRCMIRHNSLHRRGSRQCIECQQTFTNIILCDYT